MRRSPLKPCHHCTRLFQPSKHLKCYCDEACQREGKKAIKRMASARYGRTHREVKRRIHKRYVLRRAMGRV